MIRNFEYLIVFTGAPGVLPEQNDRYPIQPWKVNGIKAYNNRQPFNWDNIETPELNVLSIDIFHLPNREK